MSTRTRDVISHTVLALTGLVIGSTAGFLVGLGLILGAVAMGVGAGIVHDRH